MAKNCTQYYKCIRTRTAEDEENGHLKTSHLVSDVHFLKEITTDILWDAIIQWSYSHQLEQGSKIVF